MTGDKILKEPTHFMQTAKAARTDHEWHHVPGAKVTILHWTYGIQKPHQSRLNKWMFLDESMCLFLSMKLNQTSIVVQLTSLSFNVCYLVIEDR